MSGVYDYRLVVLSFVVAALAAYTALDLVGRVSAAEGRARHAWLLGGVTAMSTGIWSMHFIGMLAWRLPVPISYDPLLCAASLGIAVAASALALCLMTRERAALGTLVIAAPWIGLGMAGMHYAGMAAIRVPAHMHLSAGWVTLSVLIAAVASFVGLVLGRRAAAVCGPRSLGWRAGSALVMGTAIWGMHYTGMAAVSLHPLPHLHVPTGEEALTVPAVLTVGLVVGTLAILGLALVSAAIDRQVRFSLHERALAQEADHVRRSEARFRALVQRSSDVILILDTDSRVRYASPSLERIFGYAPDDIPGTRLLDLIHPEDLAAASAYITEADGASRDLRPTVWRMRQSDGGWRHVDCVGANLTDEEWVGGIVLNMRDITERVKLEAELMHQAFHDSLTGLANRVLFRDRVEHALRRQGRGQAGVAVLFLDLDDFKTINDSLGHDAGDGLLCAVAARLLNATRGCDTVARLGGDEFAVSLENVRKPEEAVVVAERILEAMTNPFHLVGRDVRVSVSLGVVIADAEDGVEALLRNADLAMYSAKNSGKNRYELFVPEMHSRIVDRLQLEADLRAAVDRLGNGGGPFHLVYQPIVELATGAVTSAEALVRWTHPERGLVSPAEFIPLAEELGVIGALGRWIIREACGEAALWEPGADGDAPSVSINISGRQLSDRSLPGKVQAILRDTGLEASRVIFEITETAIMADTEEALRSLSQIRELGIRVAVDDFGTGYSSLSYLQKFPIDILKIDKAFVEAVASGGQAAALTRTIVALADTLALRTVAEGIETEEQAEHLAILGCDSGQGYLFAAPMRAEQARSFIRASDAVALV